MPNPKYPQDLSIILQADNNSSPEEKNREGWIMSISKSFCGATAALMAVDGRFGEKKMDATLMDVLDAAELNNTPDKEDHVVRADKIKAYREMVTAKECGNVTMSEILSHRSGLVQENGYFTDTPQFTKNNLGLLNSKLVSYKEENRGKKFSYNNPAYLLAEELMGLASESGDYYEELKDRIIQPLKMNHTLRVDDSNESRKTASEIVNIKGVADYYWDQESEKDVRCDPLKNTQTGDIPPSAGGLCSSVSDLEIYSSELSKMICGIPSLLIPDEEKAKEVHKCYLDSYKSGESCGIDYQASDDIMYSVNHYSLGIIIGAIGADGKEVPSRANRDKQLFMKHDGNYPGNDAKMKILMPISFADFEEGRAAELSNVVPVTNTSIEQSDMVVRHSLLTLVSHDYAKEMDGYFASKSEETNKFLNDPDRSYWQHIAVVKNHLVSPGWQDDLVEKGQLPSNFADYHAEIRAAYEPAREFLNNYIAENGYENEDGTIRPYLNEEGIIDSEVIKLAFNKAGDFEKLQEMLEPHLQVARSAAAEVFARADEQLGLEQRSVTESSSTSSDRQIASDVIAQVVDSIVRNNEAIVGNNDIPEESWVKSVEGKSNTGRELI